ncbi:MAG: hypothetical protein ABGW87_07740 [Sphingomonadaceae bacterium]
MLNFAIITFLASAPVITAPFILTERDALEVDRKINIDKCHLKNNRYSRYYWYDYISTGTKYQIDPYKVRFAIFDSSNPRVFPVADMPREDGKNKHLMAFGVYIINKEVTLELHCVNL